MRYVPVKEGIRVEPKPTTQEEAKAVMGRREEIAVMIRVAARLGYCGGLVVDGECVGCGEIIGEGWWCGECGTIGSIEGVNGT